VSTAPDADPVRVVLVDDTVDLRDLLRFALKRHSFDVVGEAGDGREGIEVVTRLRPDLILLDMAMPVMDGLEALPHMRKACPAAKIVVLSGFGAAEMTRRAVAAGADGYLQKGAPISRIIQYVREVTSLPMESSEPAGTAAPLVAVLDAPTAPVQASATTPDRPDQPDRPGGASGSETELLRRVIATTAHEIRTPVTVLTVVAESLRAATDPRDTEQLLARLDRQARLLDRISADLLVSAQAHRGSPGHQRQVVRPGPVIEGVLAHRHHVGVRIEDDRAVLVDPHRLDQMLENLVDNAEKYGAPPVAVRVRGLGDRVCIDVEDAGSGVPTEFRDRLFEEFSRADDAPGPGTGLGLFVVRSLAEAQGGTATYVPGPFGGSVFTVTFPAV
jgi:signal transduction histidine kinase